MKNRILILALVLFCFTHVYAQLSSLELTFTAIDSAAYVQLDSIKVMNRTQGNDTMIYWPDTTLTYNITPGDTLLFIGYSIGFPVGVQKINKEKEQFQLFQNYPNPVKDQCMFSIYVPEKGTVNVIVTDIQGRMVIATDWQLDKGNHSYRFSPGDGNLFFLTTQWSGISQSIKILNLGASSGKKCSIEYIGRGVAKIPLKASLLKLDQESGVLDTPQTNKTYTFQFATNIPCPGTPTVEYEGHVYNTIQIYSQCWLKENLNVGTMINGVQNQTNNSVIEKYCYEDNPENCNTYGGLYQWDEVMQYTTQQGTQGICPPGWHVPTDDEWKVLEGAVNSTYGIGDNTWDWIDYRGFDAGKNLKTTMGWNYGIQGTDLFGFSGLPGGYRWEYGGTFNLIGKYGLWWTSSEFNYIDAWIHSLYHYERKVWRDHTHKELGVSVRCLRD